MSLDSGPKPRPSPWELSVAPPPEQWDAWSELDPAAWPERRERHYALSRTICFNRESACGIVAYVDKETERITKFEGNPVHPALEDIGGRIRKAILEKRNEEVMYHVGRPGEDHFVLRMLQAWSVDGHDSHSNVCSASARLGYTLWIGADRPSPDYSEAAAGGSHA
jgi:hypothetical protein